MRQLRLVERYPLLADVEIRFGSTPTDWLPGRVIAHDAPAVWVQLTDGRRYFVTNSRRIRMRQTR